MTATGTGQPNTPRNDTDKAAWRTRLLAARRAVPGAVRAAEAAALTEAVGRWAAGRPGTACGYVPVGTEPGSVAMLDALREAGWRVLLPVVPREKGSTGTVRPAALDWAEYHGSESLATGPFGLREPAGDRLGPEAVAQADLVLVPALAVDRRGVRLGRGGGYYDRSLPLASPDALLVAVVRDAELVDELPAEEHDVRMTAVLTPGRGLVSLPMDRGPGAAGRFHRA